MTGREDGDQADARRLTKRRRPMVWLPLLLGGLFTVNLLIGKFSVSSEISLPYLRDTPEYLLLLATAAALVYSALVIEANQAAPQDNNHEE